MKKQKFLQAGLPAEALSGVEGAKAGQTLIEVLLAFSVLVLVLGAVVLGITTSLSNVQYTKNQNLANSYAQEGVAVVRQIRDSSWDAFRQFTTNTIYCLDLNSAVLRDAMAPNCGSNVGFFSRQVVLVHDSLECCSNADASCTGGLKGSKANVKVSWTDSKCPIGTTFCHKTELITCFSNIDPKPTP